MHKMSVNLGKIYALFVHLILICTNISHVRVMNFFKTRNYCSTGFSSST